MTRRPWALVDEVAAWVRRADVGSDDAAPMELAR